MVSLISIIFNLLKPNKIIKIRRLPPRKILNAHLLGLTIGLISTFVAIPSYLSNPAYSTFSPSYILLLFILLFLFGTFLGGIFVLVIGLLLLLPHFTGVNWEAFYYMSYWYIGGYIFGAIFAILYDDFAFLHTITFGKKDVKVVFIFDRKRKFNIIKSPCQFQAKSPCNCEVEEHEDLRKLDPDRKLYNYNLEFEPCHPYTIAFVANPCIWNEKKKKYEKDRIIDNLDLFLRSVNNALHSFEQDEVLGRSEIWSRVRVVAFFDYDLADVDLNKKDIGDRIALVEPFTKTIAFDGKVAENLLSPREDMWRNYQNMLEMIYVSEHDKQILNKTIGEIDVIFALSASPQYTRSTAYFSDWHQDGLVTLIDDRPGREFEFNPNPFRPIKVKINGKKAELNLYPDLPEKPIIINPETLSASTLIKAKHDEYAFHPGRVAVNVIGTTRKTYIHEFGHAMSSAINGAIVDEYFDTYETIEAAGNGSKASDETLSNIPFYVNRIERPKRDDGQIHPIPMVFVKYDHTIYHSEINHPSAKEEWLGYFPVRITPLATCTMDRTDGSFRFDKLLSKFMYDRLLTKINRQHVRS